MRTSQVKRYNSEETFFFFFFEKSQQQAKKINIKQYHRRIMANKCSYILKL